MMLLRGRSAVNTSCVGFDGCGLRYCRAGFAFWLSMSLMSFSGKRVILEGIALYLDNKYIINFGGRAL